MRSLGLLFESIKNNKFLVLISSLSVLILVGITPLAGIYFLLLVTPYFVYQRTYKSIFISWGSFIISWYLIFTGCLLEYDGVLVFTCIECGKTSPEVLNILFFIQDEYADSIFETLCLETFFFLSG